MHAAFTSVTHRPWPLPGRPWAMAMRWHDLLFAHWRVEPEAIRALVPARLALDTFDGTAWIGVVPFRMSGVRPRGCPLAAAFPELNVRTYVRTRDRPGVWFFSLDAASRLAVRAARRLFGLSYFDADMACTREGEDVAYRSHRTLHAAAAADFAARYGPSGPVFRAAPGSLEHWLTERYCLYAERPGGALLRGEVHHPPWPLQAARAAIEEDTMAAASGIHVPPSAPHLLFARRLDVVAWTPQRVGA